MIKAVDELNSTGRNLMGLADLCSVMGTITGDDIWEALYSLTAHCAKQTRKPAEGLMWLIAEE